MESSHALAFLMTHKNEISPDTIAVVNLSGRGDKDVSIVEKYRPMEK